MEQSDKTELWDAYDKNRVKTGNVIVRGEERKAGEYNLIVHVCIFNKDNQMLIQQRTENKKAWPGLWDFSMGGHVLKGETSQQGAQREVQEELGIPVDLSDAEPYFTVYFSNRFDDYYLIEESSIKLCDLVLQKEEVQHAGWATKDEIKAMIDGGKFISYHKSLVDLLFDMKECRGAHTAGGTREA